MTKTQIDKLGDRLRKGNISETDLKMLDNYRKSYGAAYEKVILVIREKLKLEPTGRPAKSTTSIVDKLRRESIRLSQIQDIAGCRIVVENIHAQHNAVERIKAAFSSLVVIDRRSKPSYGYRAVHLIVKMDSKLIEVQVRTVLQHEWAELSERFSDRIDPAIKYGGGSRTIQNYLLVLSNQCKDYEDLETQIEPTHKAKEEALAVSLKELSRKMMEKIKKEILDSLKLSLQDEEGR